MNLFARKAGHVLRPKPQVLHGIEIKKQPTLAYIEATERTAGLLTELLDEAFPGMTPGQVVDHLTSLTAAQFKELAGRLMSIVPRKALAIMRDIVGARDNPAWDALTPFEHSEVLRVFWAMNDLSAFFTNARSVIEHLRRQTPDTGLNG